MNKTTAIRVAICVDIPEFNGNRIFDKAWASRFPGALWMSIFKESNPGWEIVSGDLALSNVQTGYWEAGSVLVIQELQSFHAAQLLAYGAIPFILTAAESPLYAYEFYDQLPTIAAPFQHRILFRGALNALSNEKNNRTFYFPSFSDDAQLPVIPWEQKKFAVLVASNKYWKLNRFTYKIEWPIRTLKRYIREKRRNRSPHLISATRASLHDARYSIVLALALRNKIEVFGAGWDNPDRYSNEWWKKFSPLVPQFYKGRVADKIALMSDYQFAVCFENTDYPGYITEKIIECFAAGVIPIYTGASDIEEFIPAELFINYRSFASVDYLVDYLEKMSPEAAAQMIEKARAFIYNGEGRRYSFQANAQQIAALIEGSLV
jgi:hypothetical protein